MVKVWEEIEKYPHCGFVKGGDDLFKNDFYYYIITCLEPSVKISENQWKMLWL